jgi:hypothetical protein
MMRRLRRMDLSARLVSLIAPVNTSSIPKESFEREIAFGIAAPVNWADNTQSRIQS